MKKIKLCTALKTLFLGALLTSCANETLDFSQNVAGDTENNLIEAGERHEALNGLTVRLENVETGLWARITGTGNYSELEMTTQSSTGDWPRFSIEEVEDNGDYYYRFLSISAEKRMRPSGSGSQVLLGQSNWTGDYTQWLITEVSSGIYTLTNKSQGTLLSAGANENQATLEHTTNGTAAQTQWYLKTIDGNIISGPTTDGKLEAEDYTSMSGIQTEVSSEGTDNVGWINNGDWIMFGNVDLTNIAAVNARVASSTNGGAIQLRLGSPTGNLVGSLAVANTGGWQSWTTLSTAVQGTNGIQDLFLVFTGADGYLFNINWIELLEDDDEITTPPPTGLHAAFAEFDEGETEIYLSEDGENVVIETTGNPNHTTPYWGEGHPLYVEPTVAVPERMAPSIITDRDGSDVLTITTNPQLAATSTTTGLGTIGISVSGAAIFNNFEGDGPLQAGTASGLDYAGGHIGPGVYHYHLEPKPISTDDDSLIGVIADGFFIYGRKCASTGTYPTDLDESGGHVSTTQHTDVAEYHYHIVNELYLDLSYIIFEGPYQGTPSIGNGNGGPGGGGPR